MTYKRGDRIAFRRRLTPELSDSVDNPRDASLLAVGEVQAYDFRRDLYYVEIDGQTHVLSGSFVRDGAHRHPISDFGAQV